MYKRNCSCSGKGQKPMGMYPHNMSVGQWAHSQAPTGPTSQPMHGAVAPGQMGQPWAQLPMGAQPTQGMTMPTGHLSQAMPGGMTWDTAGVDPSLMGHYPMAPHAGPMMPGGMPGYGAGPIPGASTGMPWQQMPGGMPGSQIAPMHGMQQWPTATPYGTDGCC